MIDLSGEQLSLHEEKGYAGKNAVKTRSEGRKLVNMYVNGIEF